MSSTTSSKTGLSRIPTFGIRKLTTPTAPTESSQHHHNQLQLNTYQSTPHIDQLQSSHSNQSDEEPSTSTASIIPDLVPSDKDIGRKVCVGEKQGILRYIGSVHFAKGTWCGIELLNSIGKNDGLVNGVRYFACANSRGLMAPSSKVCLANNDTDDDGGDSAHVNENDDDSDKNDGGNRCLIEDTRSGPYSIIYIDRQHCGGLIELEKPTRHFEPTEVNSDQGKYLFNRNAEHFPHEKHDAESLCQERSADGNLTYPIITENKVSSANKRTNDDVSSEYCAVSANSTTTTTTTASSSSSASIASSSSTKCRDDFEFEVKRRRKSQQSDSVFTLDKPKKIPQLRPLQFNEIDCLSAIKQHSSINQLDNNDSNRNDSLECDESLGILTPNQIQSPLLDYNPLVISGKVKMDERSLNSTSAAAAAAATSSGAPTDAVINDFNPKHKKDLQSPVLNSTADFSMGILDVDQMLANCSMFKEEASALNLDFSNIFSPEFNKITNRDGYKMISCEHTPSPEELPLDTTPIIESETECKTTSISMSTSTSTSKTTSNNSNNNTNNNNNCFVTSITSVTSLDNGYQGDGEMSRPASRGAADTSPLTRRPFPMRSSQPATGSNRPANDQLTDSDFCTESDADNHEEFNLHQCVKGDRKAQVIDGNLYGGGGGDIAGETVMTADVYAINNNNNNNNNNRENMESSGVFTDMEATPRNGDDDDDDEDANRTRVVGSGGGGDGFINEISPSDSSKTLSGTSQNLQQHILQKTSSSDHTLNETVKENIGGKRNLPLETVRSDNPASLPIAMQPSLHHNTRRALKEQNLSGTKKYKILPKRIIPLKNKQPAITVAAATAENLRTPQDGVLNDKKSPITIKKTTSNNKWNEVMSKISKNETRTKPNFKNVKSKVFDNLNNKQQQQQQKQQSNSNENGGRKTPQRSAVNQSNKRRLRSRIQSTPSVSSAPLEYTSSSKKIVGSTVESSLQSSLSDLSVSTSAPSKRNAPKIGSTKKCEPIQVLTTSKLTSSKKLSANLNATNKNAAAPATNGGGPSKGKNKVPVPLLAKEPKKLSAKGGRISPLPPPPPLPAQLSTETPPTARAETRLPLAISNHDQQSSNSTVSSTTSSIVEALAILVQHLVYNVGAFQVPILKDEINKSQYEIEQLKTAYRQLEETLTEEKNRRNIVLEEEQEKCRLFYTPTFEKLHCQIEQLKEELQLERETHEKQMLDERLSATLLHDENKLIRNQLDDEQIKCDKLKKELDFVQMQNDKIKQQMSLTENSHKEKLKLLIEENERLKDEIDRLLDFGGDVSKQEVQSLRVVVDLKQKEVTELRKSLEINTRKLELLLNVEEKALALQTRCEDYQHQLENKTEYAQTLQQENQRLEEQLKEMQNQKRRLTQHNEELMWKITRNKEVITKVIEQTDKLNVLSSSATSTSEKSDATTTTAAAAAALNNSSLTVGNSSTSRFNKSNISVDSSKCSGGSGRRSRNSIVDFDMDMGDLSPPSSPQIKGVVEKSDSVSYMLDLNEHPDVVASRIVRRSFRNTSRGANIKSPPPPTSPHQQQQQQQSINESSDQMKNSSSFFHNACSTPSNNRHASTRLIGKTADEQNGGEEDNVFLWNIGSPVNDIEHDASFSQFDHNNDNKSIRFIEDDDDDELDIDLDLQLPALPNEMDKSNDALVLPSPKRLASDPVTSDGSNSEDESGSSTDTSSSQL